MSFEKDKTMEQNCEHVRKAYIKSTGGSVELICELFHKAEEAAEDEKVKNKEIVIANAKGDMLIEMAKSPEVPIEYTAMQIEQAAQEANDSLWLADDRCSQIHKGVMRPFGSVVGGVAGLLGGLAVGFWVSDQASLKNSAGIEESVVVTTAMAGLNGGSSIGESFCDKVGGVTGAIGDKMTNWSVSKISTSHQAGLSLLAKVNESARILNTRGIMLK